jgi:ATP-dependent Clp protease ATP-binding subunit ClpA
VTAFTQYVRSIVEAAGREAQAQCSASIEAQHVLLAIAAHDETKAGQFLSAVGLTPESLRGALERELERSLNTAGTSLGNFNLQRRRGSSSAPVPRLGASVRLALERGVSRLRKGPKPAHLLLGILQADIGTVPRALELLGYDRAELLARARQALTEE